MTQLKISNEEHIKDILEMHNAKIAIAQIAKKYGVYHQNISNVLKRYAGYKSTSISLKNIDYFNSIDTHAKAYLAGFIAADGAIVGQELTITIHEKDRIILDFLKSELQSKNDIQVISKGESNHVRFVTSNNNIVDALKAIGIEQNKSLTMKNIIVNIPKEFRATFILGYFDGDGSINVREVFYRKSYSRKNSVQIRATKEFALGIVNELKIQQFHLTNEKMPNLSINCIDQIKLFYDKIYKHSPIYLSRKKDKFNIAFYRSINKALYKELYDQHICQDQTISYSY